jgi:glycerate 2-kinase
LVGPPPHSLIRSIHNLRTDLQDILIAAVRAADAAMLVRTALGDASVDDALTRASAVDVVAVGKAAGPMLTEFLRSVRVPARTAVGIGPVRPPTLPAGATWFDAAHPVPDERSVAAARGALQVAQRADDHDLLIVLLSGGASALMALPTDDLTLDDKQETVRRLLKAGATIHELNTARKHLSAIKGGRFGAATRAAVVTLAISDVVGDDLSIIGSGPTMPDPSTFGNALGVLDSRGGRASYPAAVVSHFERGARGEIDETPKPDDPRLQRSVARIIGGRLTAVAGAVGAARSRGYNVHTIETPIVGEARDAAAMFASEVRQALARLTPPLCIVGSGETTVHVTGDGLGGRNQEFALAMLSFIADLARSAPHAGRSALHDGGSAPLETSAVFGSIGTDGIDGPTDAAGAIIDATTATRAATRSLDPIDYLRNNDSYHFFSALGDLVHTGPTGTNVGDVQVALIA